MRWVSSVCMWMAIKGENVAYSKKTRKIKEEKHWTSTTTSAKSAGNRGEAE